MFKSIFLMVVVCSFAAIALAGPVPESAEVQNAMRKAKEQGLEVFGGAIKREQEYKAPTPTQSQKKIFSLYTKDLEALGGGRPMLREMNRVHHYVPLAPSVLPRQFNVAGNKMTAAEAAKIIVPSAPYQFTEDHQH